MLDIKAAASILQLHPLTVYRWIVAGKLPAYRVGKQFRISAQELDGWLNANRNQTGSTSELSKRGV
jgi:putative molybdopterin biosynthesis protein